MGYRKASGSIRVVYQFWDQMNGPFKLLPWIRRVDDVPEAVGRKHINLG